ncbi:hypothetical protein BT67DRAFT_314859 [Trichocladium antarcticum]|uniref:Uncharacterized protein n=1 Tax=Trichocladium antarcticum TaxID=1450529 RepID=A0AAN6ZDY1_9PEZI|nr:hypothetical protein BT67DRAFT_314859 [Trichocladium antarcticum]
MILARLPAPQPRPNLSSNIPSILPGDFWLRPITQCTQRPQIQLVLCDLHTHLHYFRAFKVRPTPERALRSRSQTQRNATPRNCVAKSPPVAPKRRHRPSKLPRSRRP